MQLQIIIIILSYGRLLAIGLLHNISDHNKKDINIFISSIFHIWLPTGLLSVFMYGKQPTKYQ